MEFLKQYWWCFVILAVIVLAVIIALVFGAKQTKKENEQEKIPIAFYLCVTNIICLIITILYNIKDVDLKFDAGTEEIIYGDEKVTIE